MMEAEFRALLVAAMPDLGAERINWDEHPQDETGPYVVLTLVDMTQGHTQQGPDGLEQGRVQVDCWSPHSLGVRLMGHVVRTALDGHRGGGFQGIFFDGLRVARETDENGGEAIYRASLDFLTHWRENNG